MAIWTAKPSASREDVLSLKPLRATGAVLERRGDGSGMVKIRFAAPWPWRGRADTTKKYELDEMGLWVWDACDGDTTLVDLIMRFAQHYGLSIRESEAAMTKFLQTLASRRLIVVDPE